MLVFSVLEFRVATTASEEQCQEFSDALYGALNRARDFEVKFDSKVVLKRITVNVNCGHTFSLAVISTVIQKYIDAGWSCPSVVLGEDYEYKVTLVDVGQAL